MRSIRSMNGHDHPALLRLYKINFLEFHIWKSLISQHDTLLHAGILIIQTLWDVTEFPSKVLIIRMRTWLYLWRCVNAHLLTFSYATMEMCKCDSHRKQSCHSFSEKARNCPEYMDAFAHFSKMLKDILNGLLYLHAMGCTHRGLRLSNVLVGIF